jgi:SOS-response transcriptional repressor LexA
MDMGGCGSSEPVALRVLGDSMMPEFEDGAIIVIDPAGVLESGCYVIALHNDEYIFRQLIIEAGQHLLKPLNPGYETLQIPGLEAVKGVIVQKAGTRRHHRKHYI